MATRFTDRGKAERRAYDLGLTAAQKQLEEIACARFLDREDVAAEKVRDLAFVVGQLTIPDDFGQVETEPLILEDPGFESYPEST